MIGLRFLYLYIIGEGEGHIQSIILSAVLLGMGFQTMLVALVADLQATNRKLMEDVQYMLRKLVTRTVRINSRDNNSKTEWDFILHIGQTVSRPPLQIKKLHAYSILGNIWYRQTPCPNTSKGAQGKRGNRSRMSRINMGVSWRQKSAKKLDNNNQISIQMGFILS